MEAALFALLGARNYVGRALLRFAASLGWASVLQRPIWLDARHTVAIRGAAVARRTTTPRGGQLTVLAIVAGHLRFGDGPLEYVPVDADIDIVAREFVVWGELVRGEEGPAPDTAGAGASPLRPPAGYPAAARRAFCFRVSGDLDSHALRELFLSQWDQAARHRIV